MVWPQYVLLTTSIVLCVWMPDALYQTIVSAVGREWPLMETTFLQIENGQRVDRADLPALTFEDLREEALKIVEGGGEGGAALRLRGAGRAQAALLCCAGPTRCWRRAATSPRPTPR